MVVLDERLVSLPLKFIVILYFVITNALWERVASALFTSKTLRCSLSEPSSPAGMPLLPLSTSSLPVSGT